MTGQEFDRLLAEARCRRDVQRTRDEATAIGVTLAAVLGLTFGLTALMTSCDKVLGG